MKKCSVIVPVYNTAAFLPKCLDSLLAQDFEDFEIVAVDDGSPDESFSILQRYAERNPGKVRIFQKENGGLSEARNFGIAHAEGEYLAFADSDDSVSPSFLRKMLAEAEKGAELVLCDFFYEFEDGKTVPAACRKHFSENASKEYLLAAPMACTRLFHRSLFEKDAFRRGILYEDLEFCPALVLQTEKIAFVDEPLYFYFQRRASIMNGAPAFRKKWLDIFAALDSLEEKFARAGKRELYREELEYLTVEHLLRTAALRFAPLAEAKPLFEKLQKTVREKYPAWQQNRYLQKSGWKFRLVTRLSFGGHFRLLRLLQKGKG